jgi:hypothetical protein
MPILCVVYMYFLRSECGKCQELIPLSLRYDTLFGGYPDDVYIPLEEELAYCTHRRP